MSNTLESIARGELSAEEAHLVVFSHMEEGGSLPEVYSSLARWAWVSLSERRAGDELREWHRLLLEVSSKMKHDAAQADSLPSQAVDYAERIQALADLTKVSVSMQDMPSAEELLSKPFVLDILRLADQGETIARSDIQEALNLRTANLSRILTLMIMDGVIRREMIERSAVYSITQDGRKLLEAHERRPVKAG